MTTQEIFDVLKNKFGDALIEEKISAANGSPLWEMPCKFGLVLHR